MTATRPSTVTEQDLHAFVDGELDGRRYRRVVAHLATDPHAVDRVNSFLRQHSELAMLREELADLEPPADPRTEALARQLAGTIRHQRRVRFGTLASGSLIACVLGLWTVMGPSPREVAGHLPWPKLALNAGPQVLFGRDPLGSTHPTLGDAADAPLLRLDEQLAAYSVQRPDLASFGLRFIGGNALKGGETPAIRLVYEDAEARRVFLFVGAVGSEADVALTLVPEGHVSLNWRRGSLVFALIGPKESQELLDAMRATGEFLAPAPAVPDETTTVDALPIPGTQAADVVQPAATLPPATGGVATMTAPGAAGEPATTPLPAAPTPVVSETTAKTL
jgi:anti-sigma factor RsiW